MSDSGEIGAWTNGYQVRKARQFRRAVPDFARSSESLRRALLEPYLRRYRIAELSWLHDWTSVEIAENLGMTPAAVRQVLARLRKKFTRCDTSVTDRVNQ